MAEIAGGARLKSKLDEIARQLRRGGTVKVGFLEGAKYPDGTPVAMVAAIQDFGAPAAGIPPRPFFRNMVADKQGEWPEAIQNLLIANNFDVEKSLGQTGAAIAGQLRQSIIDTNEPPLKPETIKRKGFQKPLVETGHLLNSIEFEVETQTGTVRGDLGTEASVSPQGQVTFKPKK